MSEDSQNTVAPAECEPPSDNPTPDSPLNAQILAAPSAETAAVVAALSGAARVSLDLVFAQATGLAMLNAVQAQQRDAVLAEAAMSRLLAFSRFAGTAATQPTKADAGSRSASS
jgi:hypothetical protein